MKDLVTERLKLKDLYPERAKALAKEYGIKADDLELVRKGIVAEAPEVNRDERAVISFISMGTVDRDNEIIDPDGAILTHFRKNPVVPYGHDYRGLPMAKNMWIKKETNKKGEKGLLGKTVFLKRPAINEELYHMYTDDVAGTGPALTGWSIGFIPLKWEDIEQKGDRKEGEADARPRRKYTKWELLEYSGVMIPSNREALTEMVAKGLIKSEKLKEEIIECVGDECAITVTKPEETDDFIRIPVRDCAVTATITVSADQGITALYCGKIKKIRTYIFNKKAPYNWTMKKAQAWVKEHGKTIDDVIDVWNTVPDGDMRDDYLRELLDFYFDNSTDNREVIELEEIDKTQSEKRPDLQGNPSIWDIMDAIEGAVNAGVIGPRRKWVTDLYPIKYPSGNVVIGMREEEVKYYLYPYTYDDGEISFGEATELEQTYKPKKELERDKEKPLVELYELVEKMDGLEEEIAALKEGRVLSAKNRKLIQDALEAMEAAIPPLKGLLIATEPPQREEFELVDSDKKPEDNTIEIEDFDPILHTDKDNLVEKITSILKDKLNKARGKVE